MKTLLIAATGAVLVGMSLAACSSGPTGTPSAALTNAEGAPTNNRSYTANDIAGILKSVNTRLNLRGTVETQHGPQLQPIDALTAYLNEDKLTVVPAHCVGMLQTDTQAVGPLGTELVVASVLSSPKLTIVATAVHGAPISVARIASWVSTQQTVLNSCKQTTIAATVDGEPASITVNYKPLAVNTTANAAIGFEESYAMVAGGGSSTSSGTTLEAIDGNLVIFVSSVTTPDTASLEKAVNAVVAAAK